MYFLIIPKNNKKSQGLLIKIWAVLWLRYFIPSAFWERDDGRGSCRSGDIQFADPQHELHHLLPNGNSTERAAAAPHKVHKLEIKHD